MDACDDATKGSDSSKCETSCPEEGKKNLCEDQTKAHAACLAAAEGTEPDKCDGALACDANGSPLKVQDCKEKAKANAKEQANKQKCEHAPTVADCDKYCKTETKQVNT